MLPCRDSSVHRCTIPSVMSLNSKPPVDKIVIPLSLEDSCLAWLVIDLEHYPPESLALLPLRLRYRLLANLPVLDLCRLEHTCVAEGIDLASIWKLKCSPRNKMGAARMQQRTTRYQYIDVSSLSWRDQYLHVVATAILNNSLDYCTYLNFLYSSSSERKGYLLNYYTVVVDWLISLKGYQFLNEGGDLESSYDWLDLDTSFLFFEAEYGNRYNRLTPPRYTNYKSNSTPRLSDEELIAMLLRNCRFKPKFIFLYASSVYARHSPSTELLLQHKACDILKDFLSEVEEVQLDVPDSCTWYPQLNPAFLQSMFHSTSPKLRTLQIAIWPSWVNKKSVYRILVDVIKRHHFLETISLRFYGWLNGKVLASAEFMALTASLTNFVARPQFRTLDLSNFRLPQDVVTNILYVFLVSPCSHQQTLKLLHLQGYIQHQKLKLDPVAHCSAGPMPVSDLGVEYKQLCLEHRLYDKDYAESYVQLCKILFAFPRIRLRSLEVGCLQTKTGDYISILHMAAQHPDIQVKTLRIRLQHETEITKLLPTLHDDMKALLQIPTLTNLQLPSTGKPFQVYPGNFFLPILAQELPRRHHLAAIEELDLGRSNFLKLPAEEVELLFQSIFSLPQLSQLTLKLARSVVSLQHYKLMHCLWTEHSSGQLLKKLVLGSAILMSAKDFTVGSSVIGIIIWSLLDSMAQSTTIVRARNSGQMKGVGKTDLIRFDL